MSSLIFTSSVFLFTGMSTLAQSAPVLPQVEDANFSELRGQVQRVLQTLEKLRAPLPAVTMAALRGLVETDSDSPEKAAKRAQELFDTNCLIGVTINPESRVKAARGPAAAALKLNQETVVLVKVQNEAGVTHALKVSSPQFREKGQGDEGRWLEARVHTEAPMKQNLSGQKVEYVILRLTAREAGKREATLRFDVGQGTQDLGFRAEVPVLFTVNRESGKDQPQRSRDTEGHREKK
jgi:hypothetical protein